MAIKESEILPFIYYNNDPDQIVNLWKSIVDVFTLAERDYAKNYQEIVDPDTCPSEFVDLMLVHLGNPFVGIVLTETQKRKLVRLLIPIYKQKGTGEGIVNATRFLTGLLLTLINPHGEEEDGWQIGRGEIGRNSYSGGEAVYCNMLKWSEDLTMSEWTKNLVSITADAVTGPVPFYRTGDQVVMASAGSSISQTVEPVFVQNETFSAQVYLRAAAPVTLKFKIYATDNPSDYTEEDISVTTEWQRFRLQHTMEALETSPRVTYQIYTDVGVGSNVYFFGMQMIRSDDWQPYDWTEDEAEDCYNTGRWAYHFILSIAEEITDAQIAIIRAIADYMKPDHTHYTLITPTDYDIEDIIDHWEVELSEVGVSTYVHDTH